MLASHLAVLWFGVALGIAALGVAVSSSAVFVAGDPVGEVLADAERWAYLAVTGSLVCFAFGAVLNQQLERLTDEDAAESADSV